MARAAELSEDGFRTALRELNAFLMPSGNGAAGDALGSLDVACDMFLFYGLCLSERIEVEDGMVLLPYREVLRYVDQEIVEEFAPSGAGFHGWRGGGSGGQAVPLAARIPPKGHIERGRWDHRRRRFSRMRRHCWTCWR